MGPSCKTLSMLFLLGTFTAIEGKRVVQDEDNEDLGPDVVESAQITSEGEPEEMSMTETEAEKLLKEMNGKCAGSYKKDKGLSGGANEMKPICDSGISNPFKTSVPFCEWRPMTNDKTRRGESCRVSEAWMLLGDNSRDATWWADLQLQILNVKIAKYQKRCAGSSLIKLKDMLVGRCKRRSQHIQQALEILSKVASGQANVPPEMVKKFQRGIAKVQANLMASITAISSHHLDDPKIAQLWKRFLALGPKMSAMSFHEKRKFMFVVKAFQKESFEKAEQLMEEMEKDAEESLAQEPAPALSSPEVVKEIDALIAEGEQLTNEMAADDMQAAVQGQKADDSLQKADDSLLEMRKAIASPNAGINSGFASLIVDLALWALIIWLIGAAVTWSWAW